MTSRFPMDFLFRSARFRCLGCCWGLVVGFSANAALTPLAIDRDGVAPSTPVSFQKDILPSFQANCLPCHNQTRAKAGLNLETPASLLRGGDTGPGAVAGKPAESLVLKSAAHQVDDLVMPPAGNKSNARDLTPRELGLLWRWIEQGAKADQAVVVEPAWKPIPTDWKSSFAVAFDSEATIAAVARANRVALLEVPTGRVLGRLEDPSLEGATQRDVVGALAFSPDDQWLATAGFREVRLWQRRPVTVDPVASIPPRAAWVSAVFSPEGSQVAAITTSGMLELRSMPAGRVLGSWPWKGGISATNPAVVRWSWSDDGRWLAVVSGREWRSVSTAKPTLSQPVALPAEPAGLTWMIGDDGCWISYGAAHASQRLRVAKGASSGAGWELSEAPPLPVGTAILATDPSPTGSVWLLDGTGGIQSWTAGGGTTRRGFQGPVRSLSWDRAGSHGVALLSDGVAETVFRDLSRTNGARMSGDPRRSAEIAREEAESARIRLESALAGTRIKEAQTSVTNAQTALVKAREKRDLAAKALSDREKEWKEQQALVATATRDRDAAAAEITRAQSEAKEASEAVAKARAGAQASPEAALKAIDDLLARAEVLGRRRAAQERAEAEAPPRRKKAEEQLAAAEKKSGELKGPLDKARVAAEGAAQDVVLAEASVASSIAAVAAAQAEEKLAQDRLGRSESRLRSLRAEADRLRSRPFRAAALSPSGQGLLTVADDGLWTRWNPATGRPLTTFAVGQGSPLAMAALGDDEFLAAFPDGVRRVRTARPWFLRQTLVGAPGAPAFVDRVNALAFSPDGKLLATGGGEPSRSGELKLWKLPEGTLERDLGALHSDAVTAVSFSPRGDRLATAGTDRFARITGLQTNAPRFNLEGHTHHVIGLAWSPDGGVLATAGAEGAVKLWNSRTGERRKNVDGFGKEVVGLQAAGPSLRFVAVSGAGQGRLFKADGEKIRDLAAVPEYLQAMAVSGDGRWILGGDDRGVVRVWDAESGELRHSWAP